MKTIFTTCLLIFLSCLVHAQNFGEIRGRLFDEANNPIPFAGLVVYSGETQVTGATSDDQGYYVIKPVAAGTYTLKVQHINYHPQVINNVIVGAETTKYLDVRLASLTHEMPPFEIEAPGNAIVDKSKISSGITIPASVIKSSPMRDVRDFAATAPGIVQRDDGGSLNIRGSRSDATLYVVDGIKMIGGFSIPKAAIEEITVLTGGIPAQFGDVTGGIVIITTKSYFGR